MTNGNASAERVGFMGEAKRETRCTDCGNRLESHAGSPRVPGTFKCRRCARWSGR